MYLQRTEFKETNSARDLSAWKVNAIRNISKLATGA